MSRPYDDETSSEEEVVEERDEELSEAFAKLFPAPAPAGAPPAVSKLLERAKRAAAWAWHGFDDEELERPARAEDVTAYWAADDATKLEQARQSAARSRGPEARSERRGGGGGGGGGGGDGSAAYETDDLTPAELAALGKAMFRAADGEAARRAWFKDREKRKRATSDELRRKLEAARREMADDTRSLVLGQAQRSGLASQRLRTDRTFKDASDRAEAARRRLEAMRGRRDRPLSSAPPPPVRADDSSAPRPRPRPKPARQLRCAPPPAPARPRSPTRIRPKARSPDEAEALAALDVYWKAPSAFRETEESDG